MKARFKIRKVSFKRGEDCAQFLKKFDAIQKRTSKSKLVLP